MAATMLLGLEAVAQNSQREAEMERMRKLHMALSAIEMLYVDTVNADKLTEDAIKGMLEKLDPHSSYSDAKETKAMTEPLNGSFEGIGVQFNMSDDTLLVIQPVSNGPSERIGILAGDRIVAVADTAIAGVKMSKEEIMRRLRGPKGTVARLKVVRRGIRDTLRFDVIRDKIPVYSIDATYMIRPGIGYIRIGSFSATTYQEFMESMAKLKKQGMKDLVLDLQGNGGGYLQAAADLAGEFLQPGDLIVYTEGRTVPRRDYRVNAPGSFVGGRVVVLVDEYSASAAEIVTGAIQDQDRGQVVGRRTFGKGLVQRPIEFEDGSMMRLTIAHYYTPSGRCIQKPYEKGNKKDYALDVVNRLKSGELMSQDSIHFADSLKFETLREHRTVYGGGGIMPDYFVPLDTTHYTRLHRELAAKGIVIQQNLRSVDNHRKELRKTYDTSDKNVGFERFKQEFTVPQELLDAIFAEGEKQNVKARDDEEKLKTLPLLTLQLKALIARDIWDMSEYYSIINEDNEIVKKALEVIQ
jgi:carboxyl-terminal processing protease